ncbi:ABC transporter ATP-binding protein [Pseudogracilibacillus sp. SO30301A]|uniref:ABC transporter ATP-binding protein n=1 Tax=Pseudogracilibacillus sp. SO30301A TaxID=3098291 RepID=UPI00300DEA86
MIVLRNVSKSFISESESVDVLRNVSISVQGGQFISVIGPSGSGKTTLLQIMGLLEIPTDGEIMIDGQKVNQLSTKERKHLRRNKISYVFQQYQLLPALTAIENIMLPVLQFKKNREVLKRAEYLLEQVGLSHRRNHIPAKLSGGEQQRIAIARALMTNPDIILADEMTGNLDEETAEKIMDLFQKIHQSEKKTIVIVTHNLDLIKYTEVSYQLRNGMLTKIETANSISQEART